MSTITLLPLYPAVLAAKQAAALDVASGGRFHMGIGVGGELPREFEASGVPVSQRGARTNEALEIMRRLFTEDDVHFDGEIQSAIRRDSRTQAASTAFTAYLDLWAERSSLAQSGPVRIGVASLHVHTRDAGRIQSTNCSVPKRRRQR